MTEHDYKVKVMAEVLCVDEDDVKDIDIQEAEDCGYLTVNHFRTGHAVVWYLDAHDNVAIDEVTGEHLTEQDIDEQFL